VVVARSAARVVKDFGDAAAAALGQTANGCFLSRRSLHLNGSPSRTNRTQMAGRQLLDADSRAISLASFFCPPGKLGIGIYFGGTPDEKLAVAQIYATLSVAQELTTDETTTPRPQ
jgi:hypothetical protein